MKVSPVNCNAAYLNTFKQSKENSVDSQPSLFIQTAYENIELRNKIREKNIALSSLSGILAGGAIGHFVSKNKTKGALIGSVLCLIPSFLIAFFKNPKITA